MGIPVIKALAGMGRQVGRQAMPKRCAPDHRCPGFDIDLKYTIWINMKIGVMKQVRGKTVTSFHNADGATVMLSEVSEVITDLDFHKWQGAVGYRITKVGAV